MPQRLLLNIDSSPPNPIMSSSGQSVASSRKRKMSGKIPNNFGSCTLLACCNAMLNKGNTDAESSDEDSDVQLDSSLQSKLYGMTHTV